ncbi:MAG: hypothetical protein ABIZ56_02095 [Chthoniobacteraceae bacterium]
MKPIDTYREKNVFGCRTIELFDDSVSITGYQAFTNDFKLSVPLNTLEPTVSQMGIRERTGWIGFAILAVGSYSAFQCATQHPPLTNPGFWVCSFFALVGLYLLLRAIRRIETAIFYTIAGVARFHVCRIGPDTARFQAFVERIASQIASCRAASPGAQ